MRSCQFCRQSPQHQEGLWYPKPSLSLWPLRECRPPLKIKWSVRSRMWQLHVELSRSNNSWEIRRLQQTIWGFSVRVRIDWRPRMHLFMVLNNDLRCNGVMRLFDIHSCAKVACGSRWCFPASPSKWRTLSWFQPSTSTTAPLSRISEALRSPFITVRYRAVCQLWHGSPATF